MYQCESLERRQNLPITRSNEHESVFQDYILPRQQYEDRNTLDKPAVEDSPRNEKGSTPATKNEVRAYDVKIEESVPGKTEKPRSNSPHRELKSISQNDVREAGEAPAPAEMHLGWKNVIPLVKKEASPEAVWQRHKDFPAKSETGSQSTELKKGAEAVKEYIGNLPKLATAASCDIDTSFELMMVWKGSSVKAKEVLKENTSPYVTVPRTELVFTPSDEKNKSWELRIDTRTGEAAAFKLNTKNGQMEPSNATPLMEQVSMTLRAAMAIKCLRDGDIDAGRAQLKTLLEEGLKMEADERLKKIIETEANLLYKPARLRAVTREDFNKILDETTRGLIQAPKK